MTELEKYQFIYAETDYSYYGHTNHGKGTYDLVKCLSPKSIIDVGCGHNEFCKYFQQENVFCVGVDFACPTTDVIASATNLPFVSKEFDILTSFDVLEHILPTDIHLVLDEFKRVSDRFIFSISYVPSKILVKGNNLHPSVFPEEWWISEISKIGIVLKYQKYLFGKWK